MPDLLLELFSEEIPARMQAKAADDLRRMVTDRLVAEGLVYEGAKAFVTPRRLALTVHGIPARQPDLKQERKGPKMGAPDSAVQGFLKAAGLKSLDEAKIQRDPKGDFYIALIEKPGREAIDVIKDILMITIRTFPWPKSMRWGKGSERPGALSWVRPLHSIVATFGPETEDPEVIKFEIDKYTDVPVGQTTYGHRFMAPAAIEVRRFEDYEAKLAAAKVVLDPQRRKDTILADAKQLAFAQGFELVEDQVLLDEVAGLVEWPVVLMGSFEEEFLSIPGEVIRATIRNNLKCFVVNDPKTGKLTNKFVLTANIEGSDGGNTIVAGNERVIRARLSDAKFFYETDLKTKLEERLPKFYNIVFHEKLGSQGERIARIERLAAEIASLVGADVEKTKRAAKLAKADLLTEVVGEFPELQGLMGKYYALAQGEDASVAAASEEHYKPQGPSDRLPIDLVSVAVALADKIDALVSFWMIDERPTGSRDPYALRRAALGVIRIVLERRINIHLFRLFIAHALQVFFQIEDLYVPDDVNFYRIIDEEFSRRLVSLTALKAATKALRGLKVRNATRPTQRAAFVGGDLLTFFAERLKVQLRDQGARHDLVDAVFALEGQDDLLIVVRRIEALGRFLDTEDGINLLSGTKRAANILRDEEKKDNKTYQGRPISRLFKIKEEKLLAKAVKQTMKDASAAVTQEDFAGAMSAMAKLRPAVDAFFDKVKVNDDDPKVRENRLKLLNEIRAATRAVADFSKIQD